MADRRARVEPTTGPAYRPIPRPMHAGVDGARHLEWRSVCGLMRWLWPSWCSTRASFWPSTSSTTRRGLADRTGGRVVSNHDEPSWAGASLDGDLRPWQECLPANASHGGSGEGEAHVLPGKSASQLASLLPKVPQPAYRFGLSMSCSVGSNSPRNASVRVLFRHLHGAEWNLEVSRFQLVMMRWRAASTCGRFSSCRRRQAQDRPFDFEGRCRLSRWRYRPGAVTCASACACRARFRGASGAWCLPTCVSAPARWLRRRAIRLSPNSTRLRRPLPLRFRAQPGPRLPPQRPVVDVFRLNADEPCASARVRRCRRRPGRPRLARPGSAQWALPAHWCTCWTTRCGDAGAPCRRHEDHRLGAWRRDPDLAAPRVRVRWPRRDEVAAAKKVLSEQRAQRSGGGCLTIRIPISRWCSCRSMSPTRRSATSASIFRACRTRSFTTSSTADCSPIGPGCGAAVARVVDPSRFASRAYANDLAVRAVRLLSERPCFASLSFHIVGDGGVVRRDDAATFGLANDAAQADSSRRTRSPRCTASTACSCARRAWTRRESRATKQWPRGWSRSRCASPRFRSCR